MHNILFLFPSSGGELSVICFPSKLHFEALNPFSCVGPSWPCVCVFTLLSLQISCFYFSLILICFYLFWLLHVLIFNHFFWAVIFNGGVFLVILVLIFDDVVTWIIYLYDGCSSSYVSFYMICLSYPFSVMSSSCSSSCVEDISSSSLCVSSSLSVIGIPGIHSKIGYPLVISGCFSLVAKIFTLDTTWSFTGSSVHMKA